MSSTLPSRDNGYAIDIDAPATRALFEAVFTDVHTRLVALELTEADYEAAIDAITTQALAIVSANITEEVDAQRLNLLAIQEAAEAIVAEYERIRDSEGIPAEASLLTPIPGFAPQNLQAAVELIAVRLTELDGGTF